MKVSIIVYPGSNCSQDIYRYFEYYGNTCNYIWHKESNFDKFSFDLLVIPGGFAFGDRNYEKATDNYTIEPGKLALDSPVSNIIIESRNRKIPILGICNGFQILTKLDLLPGKLELNISNKFTCDKIMCKFNDVSLKLDVANSFGNYQLSDPTKLQPEQIFLKYEDETYSKNINGSLHNIAGIFDEHRNILGMMPHPERDFTNSKLFYQYIEKWCIEKKFERNINELMLSEHISYKSTKKFLKELYTSGDHVIQGPGENAGIIDIGNGYALALRIESHNHPIFIDPYNGAATGVGGIMRDIFTMGARPIAILDFLSFGTDKNSNILLCETVKGIADYGNCFGVANVGGKCIRNSSYDLNPLLNVACIGILKKENIIYGNALNPESIFIYVGSKTGEEGIHGASMASKSFSNNTDIKKLKKNIQTGDPYLEKLLVEACLEITEQKLAEGMQDMGAGGLLCASLEMVERGSKKTGKNLGCSINVDEVPIKYEMDDCDKLISESQERMLIVATEENKQKIFDIFNKWDLEYSVVGKIDQDGKYKIYQSNKLIYNKNISDSKDIYKDWDLTPGETLKYGNTSIIDDKYLWDTYDSTIGCRTIESNRFSNSIKINYSIIDIYEISKQLIITWGDNFENCYETILSKKYKPLGIINCLNYGHPEDSLFYLKEFLEKLNINCKKYKIPILGGNVSLYNSTNGKSIPPSPLLVMIGM